MIVINFFYVSILFHVLGAITWLGSLIVLEFIILPSILNRKNSSSPESLINLGRRFAILLRISSGLILLTGIYQLFSIDYLNLDKLIQTTFGNLIILKIILFFVFGFMSFKSVIMIFRINESQTPETIDSLVNRMKNFLYVDLIIGFILVAIGLSLPIKAFI